MKSIKQVELKEKLAGLRKKWSDCNKKNDWAMCRVLEAQAKCLKKSVKKR